LPRIYNNKRLKKEEQATQGGDWTLQETIVRGEGKGGREGALCSLKVMGNEEGMWFGAGNF